MKMTNQLLEKALIIATEKHKGQIRKGDGRPYILHPIEVMMTLYKYKKSKNHILIAIVCILHDAVEDTDLTIEEVAEIFGYLVAGLVQELTNDKEKIEKMGKAVYLLDKMSNMSSYGLRIKLGDRLVNVNDMENMTPDFIKDNIDQTNFILDGLVKNKVKLTNTHKKLIKDIKKTLKKYSLKLL